MLPFSHDEVTHEVWFTPIAYLPGIAKPERESAWGYHRSPRRLSKNSSFFAVSPR